MSKIRMTVSRLLALGGLATASGSTYAFWKYSLLGEPRQIAECRTSVGCEYSQELYEQSAQKAKWNGNWDKRKKPSASKLSEKDQVVNSESVSSNSIRLENVDRNPVLNAETDEGLKPDMRQPTATRHVLLVRHGQYNMQVENDIDRKLTDVGRRQALLTGERLKELDIKFNRMVVSTMTRAKETADLISESIPDVPKENCSLLREGAPYPPEPPSVSWQPERWQFFADNPRIEGAFRKYFHRADLKQTDDSYDLLVCHGNVIRYFVCRALQFPPEAWIRMSVGHCGLTWITIRPNGRVSLRGLGDLGHLPPDIITR